MTVIHIDRRTPVSKLARMAREGGLRLKWRADPRPEGRAIQEKVTVFPARAPANDDGELPPAA